MNQAELQTLTTIRLDEAKLLLAGNKPCGAYYLAGYAVECALKACIAKQTQQGDFPDKKRANDAFDHSPERLVKVAGLQSALNVHIKNDAQFERNWVTVAEWSVESRYDTQQSQAKAQQIIAAVDEAGHGVLQWIQQHW